MSHLALYLKKHLSEKASMERLRTDLISKSRIVKLRPSKLAKHYTSRYKKLFKVYKVVLSARGGADYEYKLASEIKELIIQLAAFLKKKELKAKTLKFLFSYSFLVLQIVLAKFNIDLRYIIVNPMTKEIAIFASCTGGTAGFVLSWFSVGTVLFGPPTILSLFLMRSAYQQVTHRTKLKKLKEKFFRIFKDEDCRKEITTIVVEAQKQVENSKAIKLESLNWNKDPAIKEAAEKLGVFETAPNSNEFLHLDTLDPSPEVKKMLEEFGISTNISTKPNPQKVVKAKTRNFRDFLQELQENADPDLDVIDVDLKPVEEPLKIRIKK